MKSPTLIKIILCTNVLMFAFCPLLTAQVVFEKSYGTVNRDVAHYVEITSDSGYILQRQTGLLQRIRINRSEKK
ncbi:MAG TPA: hypothetical protein VE978_25215 [Chitinophagales bacterium]|nr:hypothetical protein [Chitinophagales bacterium]